MINYREMCSKLAGLYDEGEARAIVRMVIEERFGLTFADVLAGKMEEWPREKCEELKGLIRRLEHGEPVQYVLGAANFYGRRFRVEAGVLIPRPETEELCMMVLRNYCHEAGRELNILDIGTGSGCIAVTLAAELSTAKVVAWDVSQEALSVAADNARLIGVDVVFEQHDVLDTIVADKRPAEGWDLIVSNPPYVCEKEKRLMAPNVLRHEPETALFVPDDDPLLFYRAIGHYAQRSLAHGGGLYFEVNSAYAERIAVMLESYGFKGVSTIEDQFGMERFVSAERG